jgi:drug/metabolite transporter (DMT)-like permease
MTRAKSADRSTLLYGRSCVAVAAVLWSTSGFFSKVLTKDSFLQLNTPPLAPTTLAFYRVLFAGLLLSLAIRKADLTFRWAMAPMIGCFALMNILFVSALTLGTAANAILLQYTAPLWMYVAGVLWLNEPMNRRATITLMVGLLGVAIIVIAGWETTTWTILAVALGSGVTYAGVLLFLRGLRDVSASWLTVLNHLGGALLLLPWVVGVDFPTKPQFAMLALFGGIQMGLAYWLVARGLRVVSANEAATITLLEPLLNPLWAYLTVGEEPPRGTILGGTFIVAALAWRFWPRPDEP